MSVRVAALVAAMIGAALAVVMLGRPQPTSRPAPSADVVVAPSPQAPAARANDRPAAQESREAEALSAASTAPPAAAGVGPVAPPPGAPLPRGSALTPMTQMLEGREMDVPPFLTSNEQLFAEESADEEWAPRAEAELLGKFAEQAGLKLVDLQVECRATMCRVQMTQPSAPPEPMQPLNFLTALGYQPRWVIALTDDAGALSSVAYFWRPGFEPPAAQNLTEQ